MALADWDIVVVVHNNWTQLAEYWGPLQREVRERVVVVDNGSSGEPPQELIGRFGAIVRQDNVGLSQGNNAGARLGRARYLLFCNPDIRMAPADLDRLRSHLDSHGGLVAPRLNGDEGVPQESVRGWPTLTRQFLNRIGHNPRRYLWPMPPGTDGPVPWVLGAVVAITRADFECLNGWPDEYFLYFEDTELCMRAWDAGLPVWVLGTISWFHGWARSSRKLLAKSSRLHMYSAARFYAARPALALGMSRGLQRRLRASRGSSISAKMRWLSDTKGQQ